MKPKGGRILRALLAASLVAVSAAASRPAVASDLEDLRSRAQSVADEVSGLEHQLAGLNKRRTTLDREIVDATRDIGLIELEMTELQLQHEKARERYIARAVEAYKAGGTYRLAALLSARDFNDFVVLAHATEEASRLDESSIAELARTQAALRQAQDEIDARKQRLMAARTEAVEVASTIESTLAERRALLQELTSEIEDLEARARRLAAQRAADEREASDELLKLLAPAGPAPDIPKGFAGTGVTFEGIASWYGPGFEGDPTASGDIFDPDLYTAASKDLPFGTWLFVTHGSRGVVVLVNDRGPYIEGRILDLSQAAAEAIGITGLGWIEAEILIKTQDG